MLDLDLCRFARHLGTVGFVNLVREQYESKIIKSAKLFYETWEIKVLDYLS